MGVNLVLNFNPTITNVFKESFENSENTVKSTLHQIKTDSIRYVSLPAMGAQCSLGGKTIILN